MQLRWTRLSEQKLRLGLKEKDVDAAKTALKACVHALLHIPYHERSGRDSISMLLKVN